MVHIITDSAADFEPWELEKLQITCIPLTVTFGDREYQENINLSKDQFYDLLKTSGEFPVTAQASPQILIDLFEAARDQGEEAVYICLSSALSGTYQTACMAQQMAGYAGNYVLDSRNATGGQRMLVEYAVKLRDEGKTAAQIIAQVEQLRSRIVLYACIDTLENLYRGGRISRTVYTIGSMAQIKPIIRVAEDGGITVPGKAMGMRKGMDTLCKQIQKQLPSADFPLYVMYTDNKQIAEALAQQIRAAGFQVPEEHIIQVGAAIGTHIGINACGFVYISQ